MVLMREHICFLNELNLRVYFKAFFYTRSELIKVRAVLNG